MNGATLISLSLLIGPADALTFSECEYFTDGHHFVEFDHRDLGAGYIANRNFFSYEADVSSWVEVTHCRSGRQLSGYYDPNQKGADLALGRIDDENLIATRGAVRHLIETTALHWSEKLIEKETCGCAAAYPELRGYKTPFDPDKGPFQ